MEQVKQPGAKTYAIDPAMAESLITRLETEFLHLRQGDMTVLEYGRRFNSLYRFTPALMANERDKIHKFLQGLRDQLRVMLAATLFTDFSQVFLAAMKCEDRLLKCVQPLEAGSPSPSPSERATAILRSEALTGSRPDSFGSDSRQNYRRRERRRGKHKPRTKQSRSSVSGYSRGSTRLPIQRDRPQCQTCGKHHDGQCQVGSVVCFHCGQHGHYLRKCPQLAQGATSVPILPIQRDRPQCQTCGKHHDGQCQVGSVVCFHCGQHGHYLRKCPQLAQGATSVPI
ncbi:putative transcription factor interactor and regulator CCHC(Zn) family [Rosa chinensis]|uniref:Putative transcription factor interactor and regulator CCHC(Zn) family n=1 Tax=Rosa chinensis TaxID=74649 RepID=A0A2P6RHP2_ROSCH|nr:uncharacterized protein LOC112192505 [Rosa chinensis]PRQ45943.1 putative transcription factor interactor and regulator CCHC(Zn) family [Rosa chinensis]